MAAQIGGTEGYAGEAGALIERYERAVLNFESDSSEEINRLAGGTWTRLAFEGGCVCSEPVRTLEGRASRSAYPVTPILPAAMTACVRLSTPSFVKIAETWAFTVASDTESS
jgi:hypothetical protein